MIARISNNNPITINQLDVAEHKIDYLVEEVRTIMNEMQIKNIEINFSRADSDLINLLNNKYISEDEYNLINYLFIRAKNRSLKGEIV